MATSIAALWMQRPLLAAEREERTLVATGQPRRTVLVKAGDAASVLGTAPEKTVGDARLPQWTATGSMRAVPS